MGVERVLESAHDDYNSGRNLELPRRRFTEVTGDKDNSYTDSIEFGSEAFKLGVEAAILTVYRSRLVPRLIPLERHYFEALSKGLQDDTKPESHEGHTMIELLLGLPHLNPAELLDYINAHPNIILQYKENSPVMSETVARLYHALGRLVRQAGESREPPIETSL